MRADRFVARALVAAVTVTLSANALGAQFAANPKAHPVIYVDIVGTKQGQFKGDGVPRGIKKPTDIDAVSLGFEMTSPRDAVSGMSSGQRRYKPIMFVHEVDAASVQLAQALGTNENLKSVDISLLKPDKTGNERKVYGIRLEDANVASLRQFTSDDGRLMEEVMLVFHKITTTFVEAGVQFADSWNPMQ